MKPPRYVIVKYIAIQLIQVGYSIVLGEPVCNMIVEPIMA